MAKGNNFNFELKKHLLKIFDPNSKELKDEYSEEVKKCPVCESTSSKLYCIK